MRSLLCLSKGAHPHATCHTPVHFDVWSHHPYTFGGPFGKAKLPDDVELGDLPRMRALLKTGVRLHQVVSANPVQFWVTEFGWIRTRRDRTLRRSASPLAGRPSRCTRCGSQASLWSPGSCSRTTEPSPYQSGLYFHASSLENARAKPSLTAFRFPSSPISARELGEPVGEGRDERQGDITIQLRHGQSGSWRRVGLVSSNANGIFQATLKLKATKKDWLRASADGSGTRSPSRSRVQGSEHRSLGQLGVEGRKASAKIGAPRDRLYVVARCGSPCGISPLQLRFSAWRQRIVDELCRKDEPQDLYDFGDAAATDCGVRSVSTERRQSRGFAMTRRAGAQYVRLTANWREIAPKTLPDGFDASDPTSPGYSWDALDATVEAAVDTGLTPILDINDTPNWRTRSDPAASMKERRRRPHLAIHASARDALRRHGGAAVRTRLRGLERGESEPLHGAGEGLCVPGDGQRGRDVGPRSRFEEPRGGG